MSPILQLHYFISYNNTTAILAFLFQVFYARLEDFPMSQIN